VDRDASTDTHSIRKCRPPASTRPAGDNRDGRWAASPFECEPTPYRAHHVSRVSCVRRRGFACSGVGVGRMFHVKHRGVVILCSVATRVSRETYACEMHSETSTRQRQKGCGNETSPTAVCERCGTQPLSRRPAASATSGSVSSTRTRMTSSLTSVFRAIARRTTGDASTLIRRAMDGSRLPDPAT